MCVCGRTHVRACALFLLKLKFLIQRLLQQTIFHDPVSSLQLFFFPPFLHQISTNTYPLYFTHDFQSPSHSWQSYQNFRKKGWSRVFVGKRKMIHLAAQRGKCKHKLSLSNFFEQQRICSCF